MDFAVTRFAFGLLMLLACAIPGWHAAEQTPSRMVVELVSVVYTSAPKQAEPPVTIEAKAVGEKANAEAASEAAAPIAQANPEPIAAPKRLSRGRAAPVAQHAKAVPRQRAAAVRSAKTSVATPPRAKASCRPPACRAATTAAATAAVMKHTSARHARKAEPPLPAMFVPIRTLGLHLQARLGLPQHAKAGQRQRRR